MKMSWPKRASLTGVAGKPTGEGLHYVGLFAPGSCVSQLSMTPVTEQFTSGSLDMIPGVRFEASERKCLENSESEPSAGCTDSTISLEVYAIRATATRRINQPWSR